MLFHNQLYIHLPVVLVLPVVVIVHTSSTSSTSTTSCTSRTNKVPALPVLQVVPVFNIKILHNVLSEIRRNDCPRGAAPRVITARISRNNVQYLLY